MALSPASPDAIAPPGAVSHATGDSPGLGAVPGIRLAGVHAGLKKRKLDLALIVADRPMTVGACLTRNDVRAAPLIASARNLAASHGRARAIVCNSGCANACTGEAGLADASRTCELVAAAVGCAPEEVIVASTGVIGERLDIERLSGGIARAAATLTHGAEASSAAARAIMTTDRRTKLAHETFGDPSACYTVGGIAKGSGMIAPRLATMLAFIATDAPVGAAALQTALAAACDETFNMISVDGDMSTNDAVYVLAAPHEDPAHASPGFATALSAVCGRLAIAIARDGEGATKLLEVVVSGAAGPAHARAMARSIVDSSLVKTAVFGADPNWGRIVAAAGAANAGFPERGWSIRLNGRAWVVDAEERLPQEDANRSLRGDDVRIELCLGCGDGRATAWGCDLTPEYVRINASYRT